MLHMYNIKHTEASTRYHSHKKGKTVKDFYEFHFQPIFCRQVYERAQQSEFQHSLQLSICSSNDDHSVTTVVSRHRSSSCSVSLSTYVLHESDRSKEERLGFEVLVVMIHLPDAEQQLCFRYRKKQCVSWVYSWVTSKLPQGTKECVKVRLRLNALWSQGEVGRLGSKVVNLVKIVAFNHSLSHMCNHMTRTEHKHMPHRPPCTELSVSTSQWMATLPSKASRVPKSHFHQGGQLE